jgi:uncharacterized protein YkwD
MLLRALFFSFALSACGSADSENSEPSSGATPEAKVADAKATGTATTPVTAKDVDTSGGEVSALDSDCYRGEAVICQIEEEIIRLTNEYRASSGRGALLYSRRMTFSARDWSGVQARRGSIGHDGFPSQRYEVVRAEFQSVEGLALRAENVAYSGGLSDDPARVARAFANMWWNSSGHRANMLGNHAKIGVGVAKRGDSTYYATQIFGSDSMTP